jgi:arsenate reductase (glutaredoxin)
MKLHPNELFLYYDPKSGTGKMTMAYAKSITNHIQDIDLNHTALSHTVWREILGFLKMKPKEIMDRDSDYYGEHIKGKEIAMSGLLEVLCRNPGILKGPIAVKGKKAVVVSTPTDILKVA